MKRPQHRKPPVTTGIARKVGLARALSKLGYCSREQAARLIREGNVQLNGITPRNPETPVRLGIDHIEIQGRAVKAAKKIYLMMNKPRSVVSSAADEKGRDTVCSLLPANLSWLAPVGRLDKASEGLLLFTNDSEWGARISDPATHLDKTYHVQIRSHAEPQLLEALERGVETERGEVLRCKSARVLRSGEKSSWLAIVLDEGKNRHIRRMLDGRGLEVLRLIRVAVGPLPLGDLPKGEHRALTPGELESLNRAMRERRASGPDGLT